MMTFAEKIILEFNVLESADRLEKEGRPNLVLTQIADSIVGRNCMELDEEWRRQCSGE